MADPVADPAVDPAPPVADPKAPATDPKVPAADPKAPVVDHKAPAGDWPSDWTLKAAKGDEKVAKQLGRYASPVAMAEALIAAQNRIRSGDLKSALPKDPKPEELAQWRKDNGIPETHDKYDLKFDSGLVIGKEDRPVIDGFLKSAHVANMAPGQVKGAIEWYYAEQERQTEARVQRDEQERIKCLDALNGEWGTNFRPNVNAIEGVLQKFPEDVRDLMKGARLADGTGMFNHPSVMRTFAAVALELNPAMTLVPNTGGDSMKNVEGRIKEIEGVMAKDRKAYNKDEKMQEEYRTLLGARQKMQERKAA